MTSVIIQQLVHGYQRGHELLVASKRLDSGDADLVTRLSDLSGTLSNEVEFQPYLTTYPLPSGKFYALARTWLDESATRSGCVLTHTLLVPPEIWAVSKDPQQFASFFSFPSKNNLESYSKEIKIVEIKSQSKSTLQYQRSQLAVEFVFRYFGEGLNPIVWFGESSPEDIVWKILRAIWPGLRAQFSCCTLSLQPRSLEHKPFDLMFAPQSVYPRFHKFSWEHFLGPATVKVKGEHPRSDSVDPWLSKWTDMIFGCINDDWGPLYKLFTQLGDDPTAIRKLFLISELNERVSNSPMAAIGVMDVVEAIVPETHSALEFKEGVISQAIVATKFLSTPEDTIKYLLLLNERLARETFKGVKSELSRLFATMVSIQTSRYPELVLKSSEALFASNARLKDSPFTKGVLLGLLNFGSTFPSKLSILENFSDIAPLIIAEEPLIGKGYLYSGGINNSERTVKHNLAVWISSLKDLHSLEGLREAILPELKSDEDARIVTELLKDLPNNTVHHVLNVLSSSTELFTVEAIRHVVEERISRIYPISVRKWAEAVQGWSTGIASLIASTYTYDRIGFEELIKNPLLDSWKQSQVLAQVIRVIAKEQFPNWFKEYARENPNFLAQLLAPGSQITVEVSEQIVNLLEEVRDIPVVKGGINSNKIEELSNLPFYKSLVDAIMRSAIGGFVVGDIPWEIYKSWVDNTWAKNWLNQAPKSVLQSLLTYGSRDNAGSWERAWRWLADAPTSIYQRQSSVLPELINALAYMNQSKWPEFVTESWITVLKRAAKEAAAQTRLTLCVEAFRFALTHEHYPLGGLVAEGFPDIYYAAKEESNVSYVIFDFFNLFNWDKCKELRTELVNSFLRSNWRPGDLALAVRDKSLLRKIFKRIIRKREGEKYIEAMLNDLAKRSELPEAAKVRIDLEYLFRHPDFYEEWD